MDSIPNGHHPEWTPSRMDTIPNGYHPNGHHPEWTPFQLDCSVVSKFSNSNNLSIKPGICIYSTLSIYRHVIVARQYFLV